MGMTNGMKACRMGGIHTTCASERAQQKKKKKEKERKKKKKKKELEGQHEEKTHQGPIQTFVGRGLVVCALNRPPNNRYKKN